MSVARCQAEVSSREFAAWIRYLDEEPDRQDCYMAQIAAEVRRSFVSEPSRVRNIDFMLTRRPGQRRQREQTWEEQKAIFDAAFGLFVKGGPRG